MANAQLAMLLAGKAPSAITGLYTTYKISAAGDTSHNFTSCSLGADSASQVVLVCVAIYQGNTTLTDTATVTVGGVSATKQVSCIVSPGYTEVAAIYSVTGVTGSSVTVNVTSNVNAQKAIAVYTMQGANGITAADTGSATVTTGSALLSDTLTHTAGSFVVALGALMSYNNPTDYGNNTWAGLSTKDVDVEVDASNQYNFTAASQAFSAAASNVTTSVTTPHNAGYGMAFACAAFSA